jgi:hypothetical protein
MRSAVQCGCPSTPSLPRADAATGLRVPSRMAGVLLRRAGAAARTSYHSLWRSSVSGAPGFLGPFLFRHFDLQKTATNIHPSLCGGFIAEDSLAQQVSCSARRAHAQLYLRFALRALSVHSRWGFKLIDCTSHLQRGFCYDRSN